MKKWTRLRIEGANIDRQFDKMIKAGIIAKDIKKTSRLTIEFSISHFQKNKALDFFDSECYNVLTIDNALVSSFLYFCKTRFVFVACILTFVLATCWLDDFIWRVEINSQIDKVAVEKVLKENGVWIGSGKLIDLDKTENLLCNNLSDINYAIVSIKGCTLFVDVYKKTTPQQIEEKDEKNIYATKDGVISRIVVVRGTARVSVGDSVSKGQLLIEGVRTFNDQMSQPVRAIGEVYATVCTYGQTRVDRFETKLVKTGKSKKVFGLKLFGFEISPPDNIFDFSIEEQSQYTFFPLPVTVITKTVYEAEQQKTETYFDEQLCKQKALEKALKTVGAKYDDVQYKIEQDDKNIFVTAKVFAQQRIDTY